MLLGAGSYLYRYAIGTDGFKPPKPLDPAGLVKRAAAHGAKVVQFADNLPLDALSEPELDRLRLTGEKLGVVLENGMDGATPERLLDYLRISRRIGAKLIRVAVHSRDIHPTYDEARQAIRAVLPAFREAGITMAIENHYTMNSPTLVRLMQEIDDPLVGVCVDTANSIIQQEWPLETVRMLAPYACSLHLKDFVLQAHPEMLGVVATGASLGEGRQDIAAIVDLLKRHGKDVNIILEQWLSPSGDVADTLRREEEWIRSAMATMERLLLK
jgi:sugar phosphate isomerase/epimerase